MAKKGIVDALRGVFRGEIDEKELENLSEKVSESRGDLIDNLRKTTGMTEDEARDLAHFVSTPTWRPFVLLLRHLQSECDISLRAKSTSMEDVRHHQGRVAALNEMALLLRDDLPSCYKNRTAKQKGGR